MEDHSKDAVSSNGEKPSMLLNYESLMSLHGVRRWAFFLAILGFVFIGIMIVAGVSVALIFSMGTLPYGAIGGIAVGTFFVVLAVVYFFPALFLFKFTTHAQKAIPYLNADEMALAFKNLKRFFQFVGVLTIVIISINIVLVIGSVFGKILSLW
jgi:hypothetical protein